MIGSPLVGPSGFSSFWRVDDCVAVDDSWLCDSRGGSDNTDLGDLSRGGKRVRLCDSGPETTLRIKHARFTDRCSSRVFSRLFSKIMGSLAWTETWWKVRRGTVGEDRRRLAMRKRISQQLYFAWSNMASTPTHRQLHRALGFMRCMGLGAVEKTARDITCAEREVTWCLGALEVRPIKVSPHATWRGLRQGCCT